MDPLHRDSSLPQGADLRLHEGDRPADEVIGVVDDGPGEAVLHRAAGVLAFHLREQAHVRLRRSRRERGGTEGRCHEHFHELAREDALHERGIGRGIERDDAAESGHGIGGVRALVRLGEVGAERDAARLDAPNKAFACIYLELAGAHVCKVSGYDTMPVMVSRYLEWGSGMGALYGPGTDHEVGGEKTRVKPEFFQQKEEVGKLAMSFNKEANELAKVAESGDPAAIKAQFGKTGETCKACHDKFRKD